MQMKLEVGYYYRNGNSTSEPLAMNCKIAEALTSSHDGPTENIESGDLP